MKQNPYIGPRPYERKDRRNFYGRNREARDLLALIKAERVVLFYAQSGAGKTSLLNAQIIPALEEEGFLVLPVARVGSDLPPGLDPKTVPNIFVLSALMGLSGQATLAETLLPHTLLSFLREIVQTSEVSQDLGGLGDAPPILILDQFEEILTTHRDRWQDAQGFFMQLREALREMPTLGVVLALREDHVAGLDSYAALLPRRLRARFRMELLGREGALEAIKKPALQAGCPFDSGVAERLVDDLSRIKTLPSPVEGGRVGDGGALPFPISDGGGVGGGGVIGPYVEPVQLQVVCSRLWENLPDQADHLIQWAEVEQYGNVDRALTDFYESTLVQTCQVSQDLAGLPLSERQLRHWFGEQLITPMQTRGLVLRGESETAGLPNAAVSVLEDRHIVRADMRAGARWYELVHDRLVEPILQSNRAWEAARQTPLRLAARRWQESHEPGLLYQGETLKGALAWATARPAEVEPYEREFLDVSLQAEKVRNRVRVLTTVGVVITVLVALVMTYLAVTADRARRFAEQQSRMALSRQLAAQTLTHLGDQLDLSLLLSLEANRLTGLAEVKSSLLTALTYSPRLATFLRGHTGSSVALSPDGKTMASGDTKGVIRLWDVTTCQLVGAPLTGHTDRVLSLAFSPDGKTLASSSLDKTILLWDVATRLPLGPPLTAHTAAVRGVAFSPDGKLLASASYDKSVMLWDVTTRQPLGPPLAGHTALVTSVAFSPDGKKLASGSCAQVDSAGRCSQGEIRLWDAATRQLLGSPLVGQSNWILSGAFSPDSRTLASASQDNSILIWDVEKRQPLDPAFTRHTGPVMSVVYSPDGRILASGSSDNSVILWDAATRKPLGAPLLGHAAAVGSVAFSPDGKTLASGSSNNLILWDVSVRQALGETLTGHANPVLGVAFSPDGRLLASGSCAGTASTDPCSPGDVRLWDAVTRQPFGEPLTFHTGKVNSVAFSPDGRTLASGSDDKTIILVDVASRQMLGSPLVGHADWVYTVVYAPDGRTLASASRDKTVMLWDLTTRPPRSTTLAGHTADVLTVAFSPDGRTLASGSCARIVEKDFCSQGEIRLWDVATRKQIGLPLTAHTNWVNGVTFSPDGKSLASGSTDNTIIFWDVATRQPVGSPLTGHQSTVWSLAFSPDGKTLASSSKDTTVILWDVATHQRLDPPLKGHTATVFSVAFSPDGRKLVSGGGDNNLILWDVSLESWKSRACRIANRNLTQAEWDRFLGPDILYQRSCPDLPPGE